MKAKVYVDGSFNAATGTYGAGALLFVGNQSEPVKLSQGGSDPVFARSRNVAGEILAISIILQCCKEIPTMEELTVFYDYAGIECWAKSALGLKGGWNANTKISKEYQQIVRSVPFRLVFKHVKAHSGDVYNDMADLLAKKACGLA